MKEKTKYKNNTDTNDKTAIKKVTYFYIKNEHAMHKHTLTFLSFSPINSMTFWTQDY